MPRHAAFLRGMNLGGRRVTNAELCAVLVDVGFENPAAFLASGNLVFDAPRTKPAQIAARMEKGFREALEYEVPTFLRSADEVRAIAARDVFAKERAKSRGKLQVMLLMEKPAPAARRRALALATDEDRLELDGRELYWLPQGGILESELDMKGLDKALGLMTTRTFRTIERLSAKFFDA